MAEECALSATGRTPLARGGTIATLGGNANGNAIGLSIDVSDLYWTDSAQGAVLRVPLAGGMTTTLASGDPGVWGIAVGTGSVYVTNTMTNSVLEIAKNQ